MDDNEFAGSGGGPQPPLHPSSSDQNAAILNKFNNTVVLKKGQMT
jgi:hypothetical protein